MNRNTDEVSAADVAFLGLSIAGLLTGVGGLISATVGAAVAGLALVLVGALYFVARQAISA